MTRRLFLSCEHGGNDVPPPFRPFFRGAAAVLASHRGLDLGALDLFTHLRPLADASYSTTLSRLCIEMNRSEGHRQLFSAYTKALPPPLKEVLLAHYHAYRDPVIADVAACLRAKEQVLHVSMHSFTPVLDGIERPLDIGLLYDPSRAAEKAFCTAWDREIRRRAPGLRVRMNRPYKGTADGFTTALRRRFPKGYAGIELEVNQRFAAKGRMHADIKAVLMASLQAALG